jgi:hypothetical protein
MRRCEPGPHLLEVSFEELERDSDETGEPHESIGFFRLKPLRVLAPSKSAGGNLKEFGGTSGWDIQNAAELLEGLIREALSN